MPHDSDTPPVQQDLNNKAGFAPRPAQGFVILLPTGTAILAPGGDPDSGDLLSQIGGTFQNPFFVDLINTITAVITGTVTANQGAAGASPWLVAGTVTANQGAAGASPWLVAGTVTANQGAAGASPWLVAGTVTANQGAAGAAPWPVIGSKSVNAAAPGANNVGTLPAQANAAPQVWTEGFQVPESVDLAGNQRVIGSKTNNAANPDAKNVGTLPAIANQSDPTLGEGFQTALSMDLSGYLRVRLYGVKQEVTGKSGNGVAQTVTLPASAGNFHSIAFITIDIMNGTNAAITALSAIFDITTTNLPGPMAWSVGNGLLSGQTYRAVDLQPVHPILSQAINTATTIVVPIITGCTSRVNVGYYLHP